MRRSETEIPITRADTFFDKHLLIELSAEDFGRKLFAEYYNNEQQ